MRRVFSILLVLCVCFTTYALDRKEITVKNISTAQGLSHHSVNTIWQDEFGFVWIGTLDGLNRYDGHQFKVFRPYEANPGGIYENNIRYICGDRQGHLYIKGLNTLSEFDMRTQRFRLIAESGVKAVYHDGKRLWISDTRSLSIYDKGKGGFETIFSFSDKGLDDVVIRNFIVGRDGRQCISTDNHGVFVINDKGNIIRHLTVGDPSSLLEDNAGNIWISTRDQGVWALMNDGKVRQFAHEGHHRESIAYNNVRTMCEDKSGNIWMSTYGGLIKMDVANERMVHYQYDFAQDAFNIQSISSIFYDNQGSLWLGSFHKGVSVYNPDSDIYTYYQAKSNKEGCLISAAISCLDEGEDGRVFIGTEGEWVSVLDRETDVFSCPSLPEALHDKTVKSVMYSHQDNVLYISNLFGGITSLDLGTGKRKVYAGQARMTNIVAMQEYGRDTIFCGTNSGVQIFDKRKGTVTHFDAGFKSDYVSQVWDIEIDGDNLWFTTSSELYCYNIGNNMTRCYALGDMVSEYVNNHFNHILKDSKGRLWFGSSGSGFFRYDVVTDSFRRFGVGDGMPSGFVTAICEDRKGGLIYVATNKGLVSYDPETDKLKSYDTSNNFPLTFIRNMFITRDGELFVCDLNGMISVPCASLNEQPRDYDVFVSGLMVDNISCTPAPEVSSSVLKEDVLFQKEIILSPKHSSVSFEVTSTDYQNISDYIAEYKLVGFDTDFIRISGQHRITYTNLSPDTYTFVVRGLSPDRNGQYPSSEISVIVEKPFYARVWFIMLMTMLIGAIVWIILHVYAMSVKLRSQNSANESKMRFFTNISHEFRTPLTLINGHLDVLLQQGNLKPSVYSRILGIYRNASTMNKLVNEIVDMMKSEAGKLKLKVARHDIVAFLREIFVTFEEYARQREINLVFESCVDEQHYLLFDNRQLEKVFFNLLSNAFKYTPPGGSIKISIKRASEGVFVSVSDSGKGINQEHIKHIFDLFYQDDKLNASLPDLGSGIGLSLCKAIVEMHDGEISVESTSGEGASFIINLKDKPTFVGEVYMLEEVEATPARHIFTEYNVSVPDSLQNNVDGACQTTMLIVEDNEEIKAFLASVFSPVYAVMTASCGEEGLSLAKKHNPDIIVSDVMMPGMSGSEMCRLLKENIETCHIPIVLLTAYALENYVVEGLSMGADDYVTKPFNVKILLARCDNLIRGRRRLQEKYQTIPEAQVSILSNNTKDQTLLEKAVSIVMAHIDNPNFKIDMFAHELGLSRTYLFSKIKGLTGQSPNEFITTIRLKEAVVRLLSTEDSISEIAYSLGFSSSSYFINCFKARYGKTPAQYRKDVGK